MGSDATNSETLSYKQQHERFVSDNQGSSALEIALVSSACPLSVFLRYAICSWMFGKRSASLYTQLLVDFLVIVLPGFLSSTLFSSDLDTFLTSMTCIGFLLMVVAEKTVSMESVQKNKPDPVGLLDMNLSSHRPFITHFRAFTNIASAIFILAVDFPIFPRRFCKTETYGTGLMDIGVGGYIVTNGIVSPEARGKFKTERSVSGKLAQVAQVVKSTLPLWILGIARLISVKGTDYHEHVAEYGVHWNFFFTLAIVRILSTLVLMVFPVAYSWILSLGVAAGYQYFLQVHNFKEFVIFGSDGQGSREGLLNANREGIFSCLGYLSIYLAAVSIGRYLSKPRTKLQHWVQAFFVLVFIDVVLWVALYYSEIHLDLVSRRMANMSFVIWMLAHMLFFLCSLFLVDLIAIVLKYLGILEKSDNTGIEFCLLEAVNRNGLFYFLLANLLTGLVNFSMETIHASSFTAYTVLIGYMFTLTVIAAILHIKKLTIKFW